MLSAGQNAGNGIYEYKNLITSQKAGTISLENITAEQGLTLVDMGNGFRITPDVSNSYGASILRTMSLSYMRRLSMSERILDSVMRDLPQTTKSTTQNARQNRVIISQRDRIRANQGYAPPRYARTREQARQTQREPKRKDSKAELRDSRLSRLPSK